MKLARNINMDFPSRLSMTHESDIYLTDSPKKQKERKNHRI